MLRTMDAPGGGRRRRGAAQEVPGWPPLANALLASRRVNRQLIEAAVSESQQTGEPLPQVCLRLGIPEDEIYKAAAEAAGYKWVNLDSYSFNAQATSLLPYKVAFQYKALPVGWEYGTPVIAMADPNNLVARDEIKALLGRDFHVVVASPAKIEEYIARLYNQAPPPRSQGAPTDALGDSIFASMFAGSVEAAGEPSVQQAPPAPPPAPAVESAAAGAGGRAASNGAAVAPGPASQSPPLSEAAGLTEPGGADGGGPGLSGINGVEELAMLEEEDTEESQAEAPGIDLGSFTGGSLLFEEELSEAEEGVVPSVDLDYLSELGLGDEEEEGAIPPLANSLIASGKVTPEQMEAALAEHRATGKPLASILTESGLVSEIDLVEAMAAEIGLPFVDLSEYPIDEEAARQVPVALARRHRVLVIGYKGDTPLVAIANPSDVVALDDLRTVLNRNVEPVVAAPSQIIEYIDKVYRVEQEAERAAKEAASQAAQATSGVVEVRDLEATAEDAPVIKFVNSIILQAVQERASDIHVEPTETDLRIRYRIDGVLHDFQRAPKSIAAAVISRLKVMGELNVAEHRLPQDGRVSLSAGDRKLDLRMASLPSVFGEKIVMRILDKSSALMTLEELGFYPDVIERYESAYTKPYGTIMVTGPTGSGKSTTLYATLNVLNDPAKSIITVEDPVEYRLPGITQMQVQVKAGLTFARALRAILRADPDIILVGEVRDRETAEIAMEAALTGHLVLSSMHTNEAASTPLRLVEMGIEPYLITAALRAVMTQRLVRKLCSKCKEPYEASEEELAAAGVTEQTLGLAKEINLFRPVGCNQCSRTGYKGRCAIGELMIVTEEIERAIIEGRTTDEIERIAVEQGMITMKQDGFRKALDGVTSIEEVLRVVI
jgi:type IV pilus assembly protein PilB